MLLCFPVRLPEYLINFKGWLEAGGQRRQWHPTPVLLPGKSHGWRSLVGFSPWGRWESDMTERLHFHFSLSCTGEGNGNHSSVLAWRIPGMGEPGGLTDVYGVAQSRTRLKRLSSSSSQCSCLENPRDGGAWWAALYGVAQSRTRLMQLSSSSSSSMNQWMQCYFLRV